ncbi:MAG: precorrin-6y C5,15-methyltransferase (decarboxylating) subunit CbiE [Bacteroidaceae bacterium]|nr:precorrin-6y C5,15-methyltransferase (decarboxylating) subunit CbiE [Bacteroidaceae bacterium]
MKTCDIIGISDNRQQWFAPEVMNVIQGGHVFSGGRRHHEIVAPLLPSDAVWLDITVPLEGVFKQYEAVEHVVIFASGDPLFYGFANTVQRECKGVVMRVFPSFNSLQMLTHRLLLPYHDMRIVSLTGRPWQEFDRALIEQATKIGILTDREHTPSAIARRMLEYGYTHYQMHVGEHLGNPQAERVTTLTLEEAATSTFAMPNCVILEGNRSLPLREGGGRVSTFGLPDSSFALLDGRAKMITKMPIRLLALQALDLTHRHTLWDIGACTGSVSIEARLLFPHLHVVAFEIRPECEAIIRANARHHGALGIEVRMGDFLEDPLGVAPFPPDAIFIGGHGGRLKEIMAKVLTVLAPGGVIVMNSVKAPLVKTDSHQLWDEACREFALQQEPPMRVVIDEYHPIEILKAYKPTQTSPNK